MASKLVRDIVQIQFIRQKHEHEENIGRSPDRFDPF